MLDLTPEREGLLREVAEVVEANREPYQVLGGEINCVLAQLEEVRGEDYIHSNSIRARKLPKVWRPQVSLAANAGGVSVESLDTFKWGDRGTGQKFALPIIPLDVRSALMDHPLFASRARARGSYFIPAERLWVSAVTDEGRVDVKTSGAHCQFDYSRVLEGKSILVRDGFRPGTRGELVQLYPGQGVLNVAGLDQKKILDEEQADDFERQVFEGTIAMMRKLIDGCLSEAQDWSGEMEANSLLVSMRERQAFAESHYPVAQWFNS